MKVILLMAMSANGIIALNDFSEDFLDGTWRYLVELGTKTGCIIWGRTTYELVTKWSKNYTDSISHIKKVVISSNPHLSLGSNSQLFSDPQSALDALKQQGYQEVLLSGGSHTNSSFAKLNLIDEIVFVADSVIIGQGIPLFAPADFQLHLYPLKAEIRDNHLVYLHYQVKK